MADNNVFVLFEEIKTALNDINNKLEDLPKSVAQAPQNTTNAQDTLRLRRLWQKQPSPSPKILRAC